MLNGVDKVRLQHHVIDHMAAHHNLISVLRDPVPKHKVVSAIVRHALEPTYFFNTLPTRYHRRP
jgi:hypothetical protein